MAYENVVWQYVTTVAKMISLTPTVAWLGVIAGIAFLASVVLFLVTGRKRHCLDLVLIKAAAHGVSPAQRQLRSFEKWPTKKPVALASPERRWTYDQDYMIRFLDAIHVHEPIRGHSTKYLKYYRKPILLLDLAFAIVFAITIVVVSALIAIYPATPLWLTHVAIVTAAMGVVYGAADAAEDLKLRSILCHAERIFEERDRNIEGAREIEPADAAEVDAANALTRLKMLTIGLSVVGLAMFIAFSLLNTIVDKLHAPPPPNAAPVGLPK